MKPHLLGVIILVLVLGTAEAQTKKSTGGSFDRPTDTKTRLRKDQDQALFRGAQEKQLRQEMEALNLILKNKLRKDGKNELLLRRAFLYYKIGRSRLLSQPNSKTPKAHYFKDATQAVNELEKMHQRKDVVLTPSQQALLLFIRGSIAQELNNEQQYMEDFARSIRITTKIPQSASMALILGETHFDKEKYKEAIAWYQKLKNQYDPHQKSIADYKTGWSWLLLKNEKNAQFYFLRVANQNKTDSFREDAIRALAFIIAPSKSEKWIVAFSRKSILDPKHRLLFLSAVIQNMHNVDKTKVPYLVFSELYKNTKEPDAKIRVLGQLIAFERREIPTLGQKRAFEYLETLVTRNPQLTWRKWMVEVMDLENDLRGYIQILSDHYVGKLPGKLELTKLQIVDLLNREILFYVTYLMTESTTKPMLNLWIDLIHRERNSEMAQKAIETIKAVQPPATDELRRVRLEYIAIIDDKVGDSADIRKLLIAEIEDYDKTYPNDPDKKRLLARLSELYMMDGQFEKALPSLQELYKIQPTEGHAYNILWSLFKMDKYLDVVNSDVAAKFIKTAKVQEVLRESHLKLAQEAQKKEDMKTYETHLRAYLGLKPHPEQVTLIKGSLLASYLDKKNLESYCRERATLNDKEKNNKVILDTEERALDLMFLEGPLLNCHWSDKSGPKSRDFKLVLYEKSRKKALPKDFDKTFAGLDNDQQIILLGLMAMTQPNQAVKIKPPSRVSEEVKSLFWLALQLDQKKLSPKVPNHLSGILKEQKAHFKEFKTTSGIPKIIEAATFPSSKTKIEKYAKFLEDLIYRSKQVKTRFQKEATDLADVTKRTVLEKASEFERKVADAIRNSPVPDGLGEAEITAYKGELEKAAADFVRQAEEYDKALGDLKAQMWMREQEAQSQAFPDMNADKWFWAGDEKEVIRKTLNQDGSFYTLLKLEMNRAAKTVTDLDYVRRRAGILLMIRNDEVMQKVIRDELAALSGQELLEKWKGLK